MKKGNKITEIFSDKDYFSGAEGLHPIHVQAIMADMDLEEIVPPWESPEIFASRYSGYAEKTSGKKEFDFPSADSLAWVCKKMDVHPSELFTPAYGNPLPKELTELHVSIIMDESLPDPLRAKSRETLDLDSHYSDMFFRDNSELKELFRYVDTEWQAYNQKERRLTNDARERQVCLEGDTQSITKNFEMSGRVVTVAENNNAQTRIDHFLARIELPLLTIKEKCDAKKEAAQTARGELSARLENIYEEEVATLLENLEKWEYLRQDAADISDNIGVLVRFPQSLGTLKENAEVKNISGNEEFRSECIEMGEAISVYLSAFTEWEYLEDKWEKGRDKKSLFGKCDKMLNSRKGQVATEYYQNSLLTHRNPVFLDRCNDMQSESVNSGKTQQPTQF
ncbi:MAG: hypothetical protein CMH28_03560 [Micavibrio sp.]|nr:hypothetical protein [Micavibrio sp.]